jgi:RNA polymerase sigma-70 factor (ECF subfamily)
MSTHEQTAQLSTEELFRRHAGFVARFLSRMGVPAQQLEDALQEVFLVVHRNGGYRPGIARPTSYLASIAIFAAAAQRRKRHADSKVLADTSAELLPSSSPDPAQTLQVRQDLYRLQLALERLPDELRAALLLVDVEGESCVSVAAALGSPVGTIYWRVHQARQQLQSALQVVDTSLERRRARAGEHAPSSRLMVALGPFFFGNTEASRLLELCREQLAPAWACAVSHPPLLPASAVPAWSEACPMPSASWASIAGAGPIAASAAGIVAVAVALRVGSGAAPAQPLYTAVAAPVPAEKRTPAAAPASAREAKPVEASAAAALPAAEAFARMAEPSVREPAARAGRGAASPEQPHGKRSEREPGAELDEAALAEMREVALAERLLASDPERSLRLARGLQQRFPRGYFGEERAYLEVMALRELGRTEELRRRAKVYLRAFPLGLYGERVRRALASTEG